MPSSANYPADWRRLSERTRATSPRCLWCGISQGEPYIDSQGREKRARLTLDHIDSDTRNREPSNLRVLCASCHGTRTGGNYRR